jgi:hypothetical protein
VLIVQEGKNHSTFALSQEDPRQREHEDEVRMWKVLPEGEGHTARGSGLPQE